MRVLPREEWDRLEDRGSLLPFLTDASPVVVERDGRIVGSLLVVPVTHLEALWIDPEFRGNPGIGRALVRGAMGQVKALGRPWAMVCATDEVEGLVKRAGGVELPLRPHILAFG